MTDIATADFKDLPDAVAIVATESKKGYKTTEFWITIASALAVAFQAVPLPHNKEGYVLAALAAVYAVSRGLAKQGQPAVEVVKE